MISEYISAVTHDRSELRNKLLKARYYMGQLIKNIEFNNDTIIINDYTINLNNIFFKIKEGHLREIFCVGCENDYVYIQCGDEYEMITGEQLTYEEMLTEALAVGELLPPEIFVFKMELYK